MTEPTSTSAAVNPSRKIAEAMARQAEAKALILQTAAVSWAFLAIIGTVAACLWIVRCLP